MRVFPWNETGDTTNTTTTTTRTATTLPFLLTITMPFKVIRVRDLELRTYCPPATKRVRSYYTPYDSNGRTSCRLCPSCFLPVVVAFILIFSVSQLIVIHRTIEAYKLRNQAYEDCFSATGKSSILPNNNSPILSDLGLSKNFSPVWPNSSIDWKNDQLYPYQLNQVKYPIDHTWKSICPPISPLLQGNISIDSTEDFSLDEIILNNPTVENSGKWSPEDCNPRFRVAIIIPYRDRWNHLKTLLSVLHPMLQRQLHSYQIFLVEQFGNYTFNKGLIMNAAFIMAMNISSFDCVIFHDVDLIPEDDRNIYSCESMPRHLSVAIDTLDYRLPYASLVGGVFSLRIEDFIKVNGYSNLYWGWGAEDDDMFNRLMANKLLITRPTKTVARYKMLQHGRRLPNQFINPLIRTARIRFKTDGLTTCKFHLISAKFESLFTHFLVNIGQPSIYFGQLKNIHTTTDLYTNQGQGQEGITSQDRNSNTIVEINESNEEVIQLSNK